MFARVLTIAVALLLVAGCEKTNRENIDKWVTTKKGPEKLKAAFADEGLAPDLSAHAAAAMIKRNPPMDADVRKALEKMSDNRRQAVAEKLAPELWEIARIESEDEMPGPKQVIAKDLLIRLHKTGDAKLKAQVEAYLTDWYGVKSYAGRARAGEFYGPVAIHIVGDPLGKKLMSVANSVIAAPGQGTGSGQMMNAIDNELLLGLAAAGTPDTVKYVLDISRMDRGDKTLRERSISALYRAYVKNEGEFELSQPAALVPNVENLAEIAKDDASANQTINDALSLIRAAGLPACKGPLLKMIAQPHRDSEFKFVTGSNALICGGTESIVEVVRALPPGAYEQTRLHGGIAVEIAKLQPRAAVIASLRTLLADPSYLSKWLAIETLTTLKSVEDKAAIAALAKDKSPLTGYWGENPENKPTPTLGQRATELAATL